MSAALDLPATGSDAKSRAGALDWPSIVAGLDAQGWAVLPGLLTPKECEEVAGLYNEGGRFRSRVVMARHGFGLGEYQYFAYPLPDLVAGAAQGALCPARTGGEPLERDHGYRGALPRVA